MAKAGIAPYYAHELKLAAIEKQQILPLNTLHTLNTLHIHSELFSLFTLTNGK